MSRCRSALSARGSWWTRGRGAAGPLPLLGLLGLLLIVLAPAAGCGGGGEAPADGAETSEGATGEAGEAPAEAEGGSEAAAEKSGEEAAALAEQAEQEEEVGSSVWLEVHQMLMTSMQLSIKGENLPRAKALAIQAMATAGEGTALAAAAQLAAALAEEARKDPKAALKHISTAITAIPTKMDITDALVVVALEAAGVGATEAKDAREALDAWKQRLEAASEADLVAEIVEAEGKIALPEEEAPAPPTPDEAQPAPADGAKPAPEPPARLNDYPIMGD